MSRPGGNSTVTNELLLERGIKYDHSLMHDDFHPYYVRVIASWTKIDYSQHNSTWMVPLKRGTVTPLMNCPAIGISTICADDVHQEVSNSHGFVNPRHLEEMWRDQFDWVYAKMTTRSSRSRSSDVSGRPRCDILERLNTRRCIR